MVAGASMVVKEGRLRDECLLDRPDLEYKNRCGELSMSVASVGKESGGQKRVWR